MGMTASEIEAFVDDLYAATGAGDWDRIETMLTDDFVVSEADSLPMAGVYRGKGALKELYTKVFTIMDAAGLDRVQTTVGGDYAVTILSIRFADPSLAPAEICEMFRFRDGKLCEIKPFYYDPAPVVAACAAKQTTAG
ncbi:nuclear transport factor 2 family protein [Tardibacter chloracetimidivorans]